MKENSIEELKQMLEELYQIQQARLDVGADDLDIREEIAEVEEEIKKPQDKTIEENSEEDIKNIEEIIELSKKEIDAKDENMTAILDIEDLISLKHILLDYKRVLEINKVLLKKNEKLKEELEIEQNERLLCYIREKQMIPVQKIKDKIEDLKMSGGSDGKDNTENTARELAIEALQNILEESEG